MIPFGFRSYYPPGSEAGRFDESTYTNELHSRNIALLEQTVEAHAEDSESTPWLSSGTGVTRVGHPGEAFDFSSVYSGDDGMQFRQGLHFVRQDVTIHPEKGLRARTRVYPTFGRMVQLFTTSDAAWSMSYPTFNYNPKAASRHIEEWLASTHDLEPATAKGLKEIFPLRPLALKYWVGVRLHETG
jgi:hypothetical protein